MRQVDNRYHVGCAACCGFVASYATHADALRHARNHDGQCEACKDVPATIFDSMARRGAPQTWSSTGLMIERRPKGGGK